MVTHIFFSNLKKYDHTDKSPFQYEPNGIPFGYYIRVTTEVTKSDRNNYEKSYKSIVSYSRATIK